MVLFITLFLLNGCNNDTVVNLSNTSKNPGHISRPSTQTPAPSNTQQQSPPPPPASKVSDTQRTEYLDAINAARAETQDCGDRGVYNPAPALTWNTRLDNAAYEHSNDMAQSNVFSHTGSGKASDITAQTENLGRGSSIHERIDHHHYTAWRSIGENIAGGYSDPQSVIDAWLKSPDHCANLMDPNFTELGMVLVEKPNTEYVQYWTADFGKR